MDMSERDKELCKLKEEGCSGRVLALKYDISHARVYQIYKAYLAQKVEDETWPPLKRLLTVRMRKAMLDYFKDDSIFSDPARIMSFTLSDYIRVQNIGKYALQSLVDGMLALGYVQEGDEWLEGRKATKQ